MINNITIVGGGSAGWMTAATLLNQFPNKKITLVESPNVSNIGVGESTVAGGQAGFAGITDWLRLVDISDLDFMPHCDAVYKLRNKIEITDKQAALIDEFTDHLKRYPQFANEISKLVPGLTGEMELIGRRVEHMTWDDVKMFNRMF